MAIINAPSLQDTVYSGDCPLAVAHGYATLAAAAIGDKVRLNKVYAGTKIFSAAVVSADMGTSVTLDLGFEYCNGEAGSVADAFFNDLDVATAASTTDKAIKPVVLAYDAYIVATIAGGAATGDLDTMLTYEFKGK